MSIWGKVKHGVKHAAEKAKKAVDTTTEIVTGDFEDEGEIAVDFEENKD